MSHTILQTNWRKRRAAVLLASLAFIASASYADTVTVSTFEEFFSAVQSDRTILLETGVYEIRELPEHESDYAKIRTISVGDRQEHELVIENVSGLEVRAAQGRESAHFHNPYRYAHVLAVESSQDITLDGLVLGHYPDPGSCRGEVLSIKQSKGVTIRDSRLFGSGLIGIRSVGSTVWADQVMIEESTTAAIVASENSWMRVSNSAIVENGNQLPVLVSVNEDSVVHLEGTNVMNNLGRPGAPLFSVENGSLLRFANGALMNNRFTALNGREGDVILHNVLSDIDLPQ